MVHTAISNTFGVHAYCPLKSIKMGLDLKRSTTIALVYRPTVSNCEQRDGTRKQARDTFQEVTEDGELW